ncbi:CPBP family intramembrane glutamic endopeptidase [Parvimonas micra]|uniref:CPBP family intramembrane glutamic endopeptidase n=1 Tax=Parvimonas micra TaxID=33033 RepID=UPI0020029D4E|nr:type II CAAX endopeptidase family protein [Parvimonas micra]MCK6130324.1 CPBP family intramembrane metalloprotease [Parvimonas micra]MCK6135971.1 CPBP family intramembrane metalloprotease [Parvimonas micra]MCK6137442.1 CPBP family intramembrane metalloprotease [Parvimonas micra]MCK6153970.1 CPBP family intramembrane metalloprotease [Parvimonas micra]
MENIKNKKWYDNVLWICIISYAILFISETIGGLFISRLVKGLFTSGLIRGDVYIYTFIMYILFIDIWIGVLFVLFVFKSNHYIIDKITTKTKGNNMANLFWGLFIGFVLNGLCALIAMINGDFTLRFSQFEIFRAFGLFFAVFVQSSAEELLCRGFMYQRLLKSTNSPAFAIIFNSLFFAALHLFNNGMSILPFYCILIFGVLASMLVYYFDSLWMVMGLHAMWNFTQSILLGLPNSGNNVPYSIFKIGSSVKGSFAYNPIFGLEGTILSCVLMTACCVALYLWKSKKKVEIV